jgi:beta-glucosidase
VLFGDVNPSGKLPVTFYRSTEQLPDYEDYSMKGRTYRYFVDPLFAFGYGLSYTTFEVGEGKLQAIAGQADSFRLTVPVKNTGRRAGTEVLQVYVRDLADAEGPLKSLRAFQRVEVQAGQTTTVEFTLTPKTFELWDAATNSMHTHAGTYEILYGTSSRKQDLKRLEVKL